MSAFKDYNEFHQVFDTFMKEVLSHPLIGPKLAKARMVVQFQYTNPDAQITIDFREPSKVAPMWGETALEPDVMFRQSAEFSNRFWQGKENVIAAMAKRQVSAKGSIPKALQLIPIIRPSFRIYPEVLKKLGKDHLVVTE